MIVCGDEETPIVCGDDSTPIICQDGEIDYTTIVKANIGPKLAVEYTVTFKYINDDGNPDENKKEHIPLDSTLPTFHIHNKYVKGGKEYIFRYWLLESGNLSSSMTVLSDLVLVAVYDEVEYSGTSAASIYPEHGNSEQPAQEQESVDSSESELRNCEHFISHDGQGHAHNGHCDLVGIDPRDYDDEFGEFANCPYV
jgi:hypothetical protein